MPRFQRLSLADYGLREGLTYHQVRARLLRGELKGGRNEFGHFYVEVRTPVPALPTRKPQARESRGATTRRVPGPAGSADDERSE